MRFCAGRTMNCSSTPGTAVLGCFEGCRRGPDPERESEIVMALFDWPASGAVVGYRSAEGALAIGWHHLDRLFGS